MEGREVLLRGEAAREQGSFFSRGEAASEGGEATEASFRFHGFEGFAWRSVVGVIVATQLAVYFASMWLVTPRGLLSPSAGANFKLGSTNGVAELCGVRDDFPRHAWELRRWLVPIFLHGSPMHIMLNCYFECSSGPRIEAAVGSVFFFLLFFGAGLSGNLLSDAFGVNAVGGSTACYGIIGMEFAGWYKQWPDFSEDHRAAVKQYALRTCGMLLAWEVIFWKEIDHFGHLGGFIGGFLIVLGRVNWRWWALYGFVACACIYVICVKPLSSELINGVPWKSACAGVWASYKQ